MSNKKRTAELLDTINSTVQQDESPPQALDSGPNGIGGVIEAYAACWEQDHPDWMDSLAAFQEACQGDKVPKTYQDDFVSSEDDDTSHNIILVALSAVTATPAVKTDPKQAEREAFALARKEASNRIADLYAKLHETSALTCYVELGRESRNEILTIKADMDRDAELRKVASGWKESDVDHQINIQTQAVKARHPHIFFRAAEEEGKKPSGAQKGIETHLGDYIWVSVAYDLCREILGGGKLELGSRVDGVSWHIMINFVVRKLVIKNKLDLTGRIKEGYAEFIALHLDKLARRQITPSEWIGELGSWENKLSAEREAIANSGLTPAQVKEKAEAKERAAKQVKELARKTKLNENLTDALSKALAEDGLRSDLVGVIISCVMSEAKVTPAQLGFVAYNAIDPKTATSEEVTNLIRSIGFGGRMDVVREIADQCAAMAAMLPPTPVKPVVGLAG